MALSYVRCRSLRLTFAATAPRSTFAELGVVRRCYPRPVNETLPSTDLEQLDDYSRFAVGLILERFPAWREQMVFRRPDGYEHAYADFALVSPSPAIEHGLWVSTAAEEITVGLHTHHSHFTDYDNRSNPAHISDALDHVQELLDERTAIVSWYFGDRFAGSTSQDVAAERPTCSLLSRVTRTTLRSWRGTYDRDAEAGMKSWLKRIFSK